MRTKPFNASTHKPGDKLVCGGDPVTDLIVGDTLVAGVITRCGEDADRAVDAAIAKGGSQ